MLSTNRKPMVSASFVSILVAVAAPLSSCTVTLPAGPPPPRPTSQPAQPSPGYSPRSTSVVDERGRALTVEHGAPGDPRVIGCADGAREAFLDLARFPNIAGCLADWPGQQSLRTNPTGRACGDEFGPCTTPADACAPGWRVCGAGGAVADLRQVSAEDCSSAGGGRYAAAISHCQSQSGCGVDPSPGAIYACYPTGWCSEPVCCGRDCGEFGICRGGVWPDQTHIPFGQDQGCGNTGSHRAGGVLCCR